MQFLKSPSLNILQFTVLMLVLKGVKARSPPTPLSQEISLMLSSLLGRTSITILVFIK